jgi:hypothetical protein
VPAGFAATFALRRFAAWGSSGDFVLHAHVEYQLIVDSG